MRTVFRRALPLIALSGFPALAAESPAAAKAGIDACEVTAPQGEFAQVALEFDAPIPWTLHAALRGGRIRVDDQVGVREPGGWIDLKDGVLSGSFRRFLKPKGTTLPFFFTVKGAVRDGAVTGTCVVETGGAKREPVNAGTMTGQIVREAELAKANATAPGARWDSFLGNAGAGGAGVPAGGPLVDGFDRARFAWRSEEPVPQGLAPLTRFMNGWGHASTLRTGGGSFSPVLGDGKIFCYFRFPSPGPMGKKHDATIDYLPEARKAGFDRVPEYALEKGYEKSDEVVVAMDAATGKTLWRAAIASKVFNCQNHKERNSDRTPAYADGRVFVLGRAGWVYAFDAASGKPLWQAPGLQADGAFGIVATRDAVVVPAGGGLQHRWTGLDPRTGKTLWVAKDAVQSWSPSRWIHADTTFVVAVVKDGEQNRLVCLDPVTGDETWKVPFPVTSRPGVCIAGDWALAYGYASPPKPAAPATGKDKEDEDAVPQGKLALLAYRLSLKGAEPRWNYPDVGHPYSIPVVVAETYVFACGTTDLKAETLHPAAVLELATGKRMDERMVKDDALPGNGGFVQAIGNLAITRFDGTHGHMLFHTYAVSPEGKILRVAPWTPPMFGGNTHTTSYHHPIMYAYADGRAWVRQYDGIYCYDLRKSPATLKVEKALEGGAAVDALIALSADADAAVRAEALRSLKDRLAAGKAGDRAPRVLQRLGELWGDPDRSVRLAAGEAASALGPDALDLLLAKSRDGDAERRSIALAALGRLQGAADPRVAAALAAGLTAGTDRKVVLAALAAARARGEDAGLADAVGALLESTDAMVWQPAAETLLAVCPLGRPPAKRPRRFLDAVTYVMGDGNPQFAARATAMVIGLGPDEALRIFGAVLKADSALAGLRACNGLASMGKAAASAAPLIREARAKWAGSRSFCQVADKALAALEK